MSTLRMLALQLNSVQAKTLKHNDRHLSRTTQLQSGIKVHALRLKPRSLTCLVSACLLPLVCESVTLAAESSVLGVVRSQDANEWAEISQRLQSSGISYCVIDLTNVRNATDLGDRPVVFLPNTKMLTPTQAIALEGWMSRGGRVIASGPVGNMSQPGVRQLLRSLLGAYWGFDLNAPSKLQPLRINTQTWVRQPDLAATVRGGVIIPANLSSKPAATWQSKDNPPAVVTTERSTVLGWQWGTDTAASAATDRAWLRAAVNRHVPLPPASHAVERNCHQTIATVPPAAPPQPSPTPIIPRTPAPIDEPIERIVPPGLPVVPSSSAISSVEASALQQELQNLIGRFESAQLAANARSGTKAVNYSRETTAALAEARAIAKSLPQLVKQGDFTSARRQWTKAQQLL